MSSASTSTGSQPLTRTRMEMEESVRKSALGTTRLVPCLLQFSENREGIESSWTHLCFSCRVCRFCYDDFAQRTKSYLCKFAYETCGMIVKISRIDDAMRMPRQ